MSMFPDILCLLCFATNAQLVSAAEVSLQGTCSEDLVDLPLSSLLQVSVSHDVMERKPDKARLMVDAALYLDTVRDTLTGANLQTESVAPSEGKAAALPRSQFNEEVRWQGSDWCAFCYTMAGGARVQNVRELVSNTIIENVPGDFLEAGTWRGGCSIMARVVQRAMGEDRNRRTYLCDSFSGLPRSSQKQDSDMWKGMHFLEVSQSEVEGNVKRFVQLDENVRFRKGYFVESLPQVRAELQKDGRQLAVLRGDGDMYESYMDILFNLYEFVPVGGYFICDDCPSISESQRAIDDFRSFHGIKEPIEKVNGSITGSFWRKTRPTYVNYTHYLQWNKTRHFRVLLSIKNEVHAHSLHNFVAERKDENAAEAIPSAAEH